MTAGALAARLRAEVAGEVRFDDVTRGLYATDASIYQIEPIGVVIPARDEDVAATLSVCAAAGVPVLPRGGGTSQCGQTVGDAVVIDTSKYLRDVIAVDVAAKTARVRPGIVLSQLNAQLREHGLFFPIDPSTADRATIGGMTANNSSGSHSIKYGNMVHNVLGIDALLAGGTRAYFGPLSPAAYDALPREAREIADRALAVAHREQSEIAARFPHVLRRVGGYNLDALLPAQPNLARLLVGSEGTLAYFTAIDLQLAPLPAHKVLGIAHFPTFYDAMASTKELVTLGPVAVELVDRTMIELSREIAAFAPTMRKFVRGEPGSLLLVEFAGDDPEANVQALDALDAMMASLGFPDAVVKVTDGPGQAEMWSVRSAGLNIMSSTKGDAKPVSVVEDCAVPLEHLAEYTSRLNELFAKYGTKGTWYAHASVGCLHVRPMLNMKRPEDVRTFRAIAEQAFAMVREYGGSHSGEHGDGIVRSEFHAEMFGERLVHAFEEIKDAFDPRGLFNPGKIVRPQRMDDRTLFRYGPGYEPIDITTALDWSDWGGLSGAVEMCNSNGSCRKADGVMCPSYMATQDEHDVTRGRATALRLALSGQLGPDAFTSDEMYGVMDLCVGCKACRRECPTGVDMARMKVEFLAHYRKRHGLRLKDRIVANLPRLAPYAAKVPWLANARDRIPGVAMLTEKAAGFSARRSLPAWSSTPFRDDLGTRSSKDVCGQDVVLLVDTFTRWFEPHIARDAMRVLEAARYVVHYPRQQARRPLCCGRTYLSAGLVDEARTEARRTIAALMPFVQRGIPIVGLEPSCLLTLRDEFLALVPGEPARALAGSALLFEEFVAREVERAGFSLPLEPLPQSRATLHGHCHQKAFGAMPAVVTALQLVPNLEVAPVESSCCGMAGTFGYEAEHFDISMKMAERSLLPAVRASGDDTLIVADGFSCRHQIHDGAARDATHVASVLAAALRD